MPLYDYAEYKPNWVFKNGHWNTIYASLYRNVPVLAFERERHITSDGDFLDIDYLRQESDKCILLLHGLEGSSHSRYIRGMSDAVYDSGWDVVAINYRGCTDEPNYKLRMYHSGATDDVHEVVQKISTKYKEIVLAGFSLGGNLVLKYLGEKRFKKPNQIKAGIAVSVPIHLSSSSTRLETFDTWMYRQNFLIQLKRKVKQKHRQFPQDVDLSHIKKLKTLRDFDDYYTAPIHGFDGVEDYYEKVSSIYFLEDIEIPALLINARDDSFISDRCYPSDLAKELDKLFYLESELGGHVGFMQSGKKMSWAEEASLHWLNEVIII